MSEKEGEPKERYHIWLYKNDVAWIDANISKVKRSRFIRVALRRMIRSIQERSAQDYKPIHDEIDKEDREDERSDEHEPTKRAESDLAGRALAKN